RRVRAAARRQRRVHGRGRVVGERGVPLLRRARHLDPAGPAPQRQRRGPGHGRGAGSARHGRHGRLIQARFDGPPAARGGPVVRWPTVQWFFTALLILASAGTVGYAAYLLRRLFTTPPAVERPVDQ